MAAIVRGHDRVYPRPRGGTAALEELDEFDKGLSPPTRGNLQPRPQLQLAPRSIPAHAGEPGSSSPSTRPLGVYPRPRGGTHAGLRYTSHAEGLSPPTRGNLQPRPQLQLAPRSIPAHAGEPLGLRPPSTTRGVYPRPRGGTEPLRVADAVVTGLSPPTRGNHRRSNRHRDYWGSIPAHAGEPGSKVIPPTGSEVYPRPRGGTE